MKRLISALALAFILCACGGSQATQSTPTPQAQATQPASQPTTAPTTQPTSTPTTQAITHGTPHIGGQMSDFYGKDGQPNNQGSVPGSETWILSDQNQTIIDAAPDAHNVVDYLDITNNTNWNNQQMQAFCEQFMPSGASQFNQDGSFIDYHSSAGEIVMQLSQQACVLTIAQS